MPPLFFLLLAIWWLVGPIAVFVFGVMWIVRLVADFRHARMVVGEEKYANIDPGLIINLTERVGLPSFVAEAVRKSGCGHVAVVGMGGECDVLVAYEIAEQIRWTLAASAAAEAESGTETAPVPMTPGLSVLSFVDPGTLSQPHPNPSSALARAEIIIPGKLCQIHTRVRPTIRSRDNPLVLHEACVGTGPDAIPLFAVETSEFRNLAEADAELVRTALLYASVHDPTAHAGAGATPRFDSNSSLEEVDDVFVVCVNVGGGFLVHENLAVCPSAGILGLIRKAVSPANSLQIVVAPMADGLTTGEEMMAALWALHYREKFIACAPAGGVIEPCYRNTTQVLASDLGVSISHRATGDLDGIERLDQLIYSYPDIWKWIKGDPSQFSSSPGSEAGVLPAGYLVGYGAKFHVEVVAYPRRSRLVPREPLGCAWIFRNLFDPDTGPGPEHGLGSGRAPEPTCDPDLDSDDERKSDSELFDGVD